MAAASKTILLQLRGDESDAKRAIEDVRGDLKRMSRDEAEIRLDIQTARVERQIQQVQRRLENLGKKTATPKVQADTKLAQERLQLLELRLDRLKLKKVNIDVDVDRGTLERVASGMGTLERVVGGVGGAFTNLLRAVPLFGSFFGFALRGLLSLATQAGTAVGGLVGAFSGLLGVSSKMGGAIASVVGGVVSMGLSVASLGAILGGLVIALNAVIGAVVAFGAVLVALAASAAAAAGGMFALGAAFAGILGPAIIVAIGLFQRFQKILEARKAREQALTAAVQEQKTAEQQRRSALSQLEAAEQRLAETVVEGRKAMADAAEEQEDAERSLARSRLGVQQARLNLRDARAELRDFLRQAGAVGPTLNALTKKFSDVDFDPSAAGRALGDATGRGVSGDKGRELQQKILNVREAHLDVKDAIDSVSDSERALNEARKKHTQFTQQGLRAYRPYRQALIQVERAEERLARATNRTSRAQDEYHKKLKELTGTERTTLGNIDKLGKAFTALAKAFTDPIFEAINDVFASLAGSSAFLESGLNKVGRAFASVIRALGFFLREKATRAAFSQMASGAQALGRSLGASAFLSFLRIMRNIAQAALPSLVSGAEKVADVMAGWSRKSGLPGFRRTIRNLIDHFKEWLNLGRAVGEMILTVFRGASRSGRGVVRSLADWLDKQRKIINQDPEKVERFFRRMIRRAKEIVRWLKDAVAWLRDKLPEAAETAKNAFAALEGPLRTLRGITKLISGDLEGLKDLQFERDVKGPRGRSGNGPLDILKDFVFGQSGGLVPGSGSGDTVPAMLEPGEFVLRKSVVRSLGASTVAALNAGLGPRLAPATGSTMTRNVTLHNHFHTPGGRSADERTAAAQLEREIRLAGG